MNFDETNICGIGSVGLSTMYSISMNTSLPSSSALFISLNFEEKLKDKSKRSLPAQKKYEELMYLKDQMSIIAFDDSLIPEQTKYQSVSSIFQKKRLYNIVGLGGLSGDFFVKFMMNQKEKNRKQKTFCIMPFNFEGSKRANKAKEQLKKITGEILVLKNQDLLSENNDLSTFDEAFATFHHTIEKDILSHSSI